MHLRSKAVILFLLPITICLWLIGWNLFWTGSQNKLQTPKPTAEADTHITTGILLEEPQENNA
jgi:hypothetical protein